MVKLPSDADDMQEGLKTGSVGTKMTDVVNCRKMPPTDHHQQKYKDSDQRRFLKAYSGESRKCQIVLLGCRTHIVVNK